MKMHFHIYLESGLFLQAAAAAYSWIRDAVYVFPLKTLYKAIDSRHVEYRFYGTSSRSCQIQAPSTQIIGRRARSLSYLI